MLTDLTWLSPNQPFPPKSEDARLASYVKYRNLFEGKHHLVWSDLWDLQDLQDADVLLSTFFKGYYGYKKLPFNWFKIVVDVYSDFLVGEPPVLTPPTEVEQSEIDSISDRSDINVMLWDVCKDFISLGNGICKVRFVGSPSMSPGSLIERVDPSIWFPVVDPDNVWSYTAHVLAWTFTTRIGTSDAKLLRVEIHQPGVITSRLFWMNGSIIDHEVPLTVVDRYASVPQVVHTGVSYPLVFVVSNIREEGTCHGLSDFNDMEDLVHELERRIQRISSILDIHARPSMAGPDNMLTTDPETGEDVLRVGGRFFPIKKDEERPTYITWDGKLDASFKEMDKITDMLYGVTDLSPAAIGDFSRGVTPTGSAQFRRLLVRPLARTNRIRLRFDNTVKRAINAASILDVNGRIPGSVVVKLNKINWQDGLPSDPREEAVIEQTRKNSGLTSKRSAIMRLDRCSIRDAEIELDQMKSEPRDPPREIPSTDALDGSQPRDDLIPGRNRQPELTGNPVIDKIDGVK